MKVLFLSVTAGYGHNMCAQSAMEYLESKGAECKMLDAFKYINPLLSQAISRGYLLSSQYSARLYGGAYRFLELKEPSPKVSATRLTNTLLSKKLEIFLDKYAPDVVVCTHVFAAQMITQWKNKKKIKTIGILTDYTIHPFWEDTHLDYYVVPSELLANQFRKKHLPIEKMLPFGIPIRGKFAESVSQQEARSELGIEDKMTVLLMSGSMGFGNGAKSVRLLDKLDLDFQMIMVCGNNKRLKKRVDEMETEKKIYNFGFVDNVDLLMSAADCIITKPGGLTTSEALSKGLFMIMANNIPGQEARNMEFLINNGLAMAATKTFSLDECLYHFLSNEERFAHARLNARAVAKPHSARDLGEFVLGLGENT